MENILEKINKFTRRPLDENEVYTFDVILCDNRTDRDNEKFSDNALNQMQKLFIGKTGIFDHNPKGENQTARIFETEVVSENDYKYLKAGCYMVRTSSNNDLILEIDGGIKKEVSVSCSCKKRICSICGKDSYKTPCRHKAGNFYGTAKCSFILDDVTDAYEWSFVAVPAQKNAGVTKHFKENQQGNNNTEVEKMLVRGVESIKKDIVRLSYLCLDEISAKAMILACEEMDLQGLVEMKEKLMQNYKKKGVSQIIYDKKENVNYKM